MSKLGFVSRSVELLKATGKNCYVTPGHFYSPVVDTDEARERKDKIWQANRTVCAIDMNDEEQKTLLKNFALYYNELPFQESEQSDLRYYFGNSFFSYTDGIVLYSMMRHFKPSVIIEVGNGFSSAVMLDTRDKFDLKTKIGFVEPNPERLYSLISNEDKAENDIQVKFIQDVPTKYFEQLKENDFLFIDSTHVSKTGSDVNYIIFEVLPRLKPGVFIHFHDIFDGFEYPMDWVLEGRSWNEDYFLRSFLMYNQAFKIRFFNHYMHVHHPDSYKEMPLCYKNTGGSLWLQKIQ